MAASSWSAFQESESGGHGRATFITFQIGSRQLKLGARFKLYSIGDSDGAVEKKKHQRTWCYYIRLYLLSLSPIIRIKTLLKHIKTWTLLYQLYHREFWIIISYYITPHEISDYINYINPIISIILFHSINSIKVLASFKPPNWQRAKARFVRRGWGRVRTQDLRHRSGCADHCATRPGQLIQLNQLYILCHLY